MWKFQHPEGQREINTLHVPLGRPVQMLLTSEDVIHSFFVPDFRVHMDVLPNRYTSVWFQATRPGTYHLFCSQYCGTNHAGMIGTVVVMEPADFENWLALHAEGSLALEGRKVLSEVSLRQLPQRRRETPALRCWKGSIAGTVASDDGQTVIADDDYIRESILAPGAKIVAGWENIMPTFRGQISEEEIYALIAYFRSLQARRNAAASRRLSAADGDAANQSRILTEAHPRLRPKTPTAMTHRDSRPARTAARAAHRARELSQRRVRRRLLAA